MKTKLVIIFALVFTALFSFCNAQTYPKEILADFEKHCKKENTKKGELNQEMYDYCIKQEMEGYDNLKFLESKYKDLSWLTDLEVKIKEYWTKEGVVNWQMVNYNLDKEIEASSEVEYGLKQGDFKKDYLSYCKEEWKNSESFWTMTLSCLKDENEGYANTKYLEEKYKNFSWLSGMEEKLKKYWTKEGAVIQWRMVAATLKKEIDASIELESGMKNGDFTKANYDSCFQHWNEQEPEAVWTMTLYCLKNQ